MVPVLLSSASSSPLSLSSLVMSSSTLPGGPLSLSSDAASPRGRKRTNDSLDNHIFAKRHSNSDMSDDDSASTPRKGSPGIDDERRAHHNELERRRRDHIKDHFTCLKEAVPLLEGEKSSRALILKRAVEYINLLHTRLREYQASIEELSRKVDAQAPEQSASSSVSAPTPATMPVAEVPALSPCLLIPTTSAAPMAVDPLPKPAVAPSTSPFSPVVPSLKAPAAIRYAAPAPAVPQASPSMAELAMLLALNARSQENALLQKDLASLLSFNNLALKESPPVSAHQFVSPLMF